MKKILLLIALLPFCSLLKSQDLDKAAAMQLVTKNSKAIGLTDHDLKNVLVSSAYISNPSGLQMVYLQQSYMGLPVFNQIHVLAFRNGQVVSNAGGRIANIDQSANTNNPIPVVSAEKAVQTAMADKKISANKITSGSILIPGRKFDFGKIGTTENITAELMWVPLEKEKKVMLAWQVYIVPARSLDMWLIRVNAQNNTIIDETNLTVYCNWKVPADNQALNKKHSQTCNAVHSVAAAKNENTLAGPLIVNGATYRVIPFPAASPLHPGGAHTLRTDPWLAAPGNATTLKWHSTGTSDFNYSRGNNVWAQEDLNANNGTGIPATSTTPDPLTFDFTPNYLITPTQTSPVQNQQFAITNLFYWNNIIHDIVYQYGFDEAAGNFQTNNQGRGGLGNDQVMADAQDGNYVAPNQDNATFSTPTDGGSGRMTMFLWDSVPRMQVNTPAVIAGSYIAVESNFSTANKLINVGPVTADVVHYNDNAGGTHEACVPALNSLAGKIALITRGNCDFVIKVKNAQNQGAVGVIMVNNVTGLPITMGGTDNTITIPAVMVSDVTGALLVAQLANNLNVTLSSPVNMDGSLDNGIIVHEFAHGISNRLTGGPTVPSCVSNAEHMGEGWSDYYSLMITEDWTTATLNTGFTSPRGIGAYAIGQDANGTGLRSQKYSTDFSINNKVYTATLPTISHDRGEIWAATLWDMTWNIINQVGSINPNIYNVAGGGGNTIAMRLVTEGMKLQPCSPGFIDGRNAILQADQILYGGAYGCAIKEAFRRRGMGPLASQGLSSSISDQVPDFTSSLSVKLTPNVVQVAQGQNIIYTNTVTTCSAVTNFLLTDTLPANVTYVSGGTYNAATRVVSFPVTLTAGQVQTYVFTVSVNAGSYYPTTTLLNEPIASNALPATLVQTSTTATIWTPSAAQNHSPAFSMFSPEIATPSDQILRTATGIPLGANPAQLNFWHLYNTETSWDGGVLEISTNGGTTWSDLGNQMVLNRYSGSIDATSGTPIAGRQAFTGSSTSFVNTKVNLTQFVNQTALFRWRFVSDDGTGGGGWFVDDILVKNEPNVYMRSSLFSNTGVRVSISDTMTLIIEAPTCTSAAITTQPANTTGCTGGNATFTVSATGTNVAYQWQVSTNGGTSYTVIPGATSATLTLTGLTSGMNNNMYQVVISNTCPSTVTSAAATLSVSDPATINTQPVNVTVCAGNNASFTVAATGTSITYQWQVSTDGGTNFTNIAGQTTSTLNLTAVTASMNANQYRVVVFSCSPTGLNSTAAILTVNSQAAITTQPSNTVACTGGNATYTVAATGTGLTYQWQVSTNGGTSYTSIAGATTATLNLTSVTAGMSGNLYQVIINGSACAGTVTSAAASLTVSTAASITTQPTNTIVCAGSNATFTASATGTSYQWQVSTDGGANFTNIAGANTTTLTLNAVTAAMNGNQYHLVVGSCTPTGLTSNNVTLTVNNPVAISTQPVATSACIGSNATFTVTATGTAPSYQWQVSTNGGTTYTDIPGATSNSYTATAITAGMNNNLYQVIITNACPSSVTSSAVMLTANGPAVITTQPSNATSCEGNDVSFTVAATGTAITYQWQVNTAGTFNNIPGATSATLNVNDITTGMDQDIYRVIVSSCGNVTSGEAVLRVNALPVVTISAAPYTRLSGDLQTTLTATSTPPATSFNWFLDGNLITGSTGNTITVDYSGLGNYTASVIDANNCTGMSNTVTIGDSIISTSFIFPNPTSGVFYVLYADGSTGLQSRMVNLFNAKGQRIYSKLFISPSSQPMEIKASHLPSGTYMVEVTDTKGRRLKQGKVLKL